MESSERLHSMLLESGIEVEDHGPLLESLTALHDRYVDGTVPEPSAELAALLAGAGKVVRAPFATRRARLLVAGAVAFGAVGVGGVAAAATNELPTGAQQFVAEFSERYLPFHLPRPEVTPEADDQAPEPAPPVTTGDDRDATPSGEPSRPARSPRSKPTEPAAPVPVTPVTPEPGEPSSDPESPWPSELLPTPSAEPSTGEGEDSGEGEDPQAAPSEPASPTPEPSPTEEPEDPSAGPSPSEPAPEPSPTSSPSEDPDATVSTRKVADEPSTASSTTMTPVSTGGTSAAGR